MTENRVSLLGRKTYKVTDKITIKIPTVRLVRGESAEDEENFWSEAGLFSISADDIALDLEKMGIDFTAVSDYSVFVILYSARKDAMLKSGAVDLLFETFNLWELELMQTENGYVFTDSGGDVVIDEDIYNKLSDVITLITGHEKPKRMKFGNNFARQRWLKKIGRKKEIEAEKRKNSKEKSAGGLLDGIILRLVCNANFPYNFETINDVTLYDLIYSLKQIEKDISVSDLIQGRLVGDDLKKYSDKQLSRYVL